MSEKKVRVRFAPSPTGPQHIGGIRTALYNYLVAKKAGGDFVLRIEDTDSERYVPDSEEYILEALKWAGIKPDEGITDDWKIAEVPDKKNLHAPYRQSLRKSIYKVYAKQLLDSGHAYIAFDTQEELKALHGDKKGDFSYNARNRKTLKNSLTLSEEEVLKLMAERNDWVIRFKMPETDEVIEMHDEIRGNIKVHTEELDDKVLWKKADELPTYHLANVVDDYLMEITDVIRGEEWLPSLPLHILLYRAFGWDAPRFAHLPLLLKPVEMGPGKLSKRDGEKGGFPVFPISWDSKTIKIREGYREAGYVPDAFINFLAYLGWNPGDNTEIKSREELIQCFSLGRCQKAGARFNPKKTRWYNKEYLKQMTPQELLDFARPWLWLNGAAGVTNGYLLQVIEFLKDRLEFPADILKKGSVFFQDPNGIRLGDWNENVEYIPKALHFYTHLTTTFFGSWKEDLKPWVDSYVEDHGGWKEGGKIMNCLRMIISGNSKGPDMIGTLRILGKENLIHRVNLFKENYGY